MDISGEIRSLLERLSAALAEHDGLPAPGPTHLFAAHHQISEAARRELDTMLIQRQPAPPALVVADNVAPATNDAEVTSKSPSDPEAAEADAPLDKAVTSKKAKAGDGNAPTESNGEDASDEEH